MVKKRTVGLEKQVLQDDIKQEFCLVNALPCKIRFFLNQGRDRFDSGISFLKCLPAPHLCFSFNDKDIKNRNYQILLHREYFTFINISALAGILL